MKNTQIKTETSIFSHIPKITVHGSLGLRMLYRLNSRMPMFDTTDNKIKGLKSVNRMNVIEDELVVSMWHNVRTVPGVSRQIVDLNEKDITRSTDTEYSMLAHEPHQLLQVAFADRIVQDDKVIYNYKEPEISSAPYYKEENIKASMINTLDGNEVISVSNSSGMFCGITTI